MCEVGVRAELSGKALQRLADIGQWPAAQRSQFDKGVRFAFELANLTRRISPTTEATAKEIAKVAKAARALDRALEALGPQEKRALAVLAAAGERFGYEGSDVERRFNFADVQEVV